MRTKCSSRCGTRGILHSSDLYAAFTSGELAQVSLTSILGTLVARYLTHGVMNLSRTEAEHLAREDVRRAIDEYCSGRPDRSFIEICTSPTLR